MVAKGWQIRRLKYVATLNDDVLPESTDPEHEIQYLDISNVDSLGGISAATTHKFDKAPSRARRVVRDGDVIISTVRTYLQAIAAIEAPPDNLIVSTGFAVVRARADLLAPSFCKYALREPRFLNEVEARSTGVSYPSITSTELADIELQLPPLPTQHRIADYLDAETQRIDELIAAKRSMLALLEKKRAALVSQAVTKGLDPNAKMKDSGLELGSIPEHWQPKRFKHLVTVWGRIGYRGYKAEDLVDEGQGALALGASHITADGKVDATNPVYISWEKYKESPEIMVALNDLIVVQRGSCGKVGLVDRDLGPATINPSLVLLKDAKANPRFLLYVLLSNYIQQTISLLVSSTAVPMITQEQVNEFPVMVPPREEQDTIVEYLDRTTVGLDHLMQQVSESITLLVSRRSALITAAVTGQLSIKQ